MLKIVFSPERELWPAQWITCLKKCAWFFWAYFIRIAKRNNFVEEIFSIRALFHRENSI
jgi:hypothetical protein